MPAVKETRIPFQLMGGAQPLVLVPVFIRERGPYSFAVDTGAGHTLVSKELGEELSLPQGVTQTAKLPGGMVSLARSVVRCLRVGDETFENFAVSIMDLTIIGRMIGGTVDGVLGHSVLRYFSTTLDYSASELTLVRPSPPEHHSSRRASERSVPFRLASIEKPLIVIPVLANGQGPFDFALDTGASRTVLCLEFANRLGLPLEEIPGLTGVGGALRGWRTRLDSLAVGSARQESLQVGVSEVLAPMSQALGVKLHGLLGLNFLGNFRVTVDYPRQMVAFE
jgi:predicted aspartyl protease